MMKLNISDIQHFSVGDGDGIRTTVFFKGCALHCPWCHNPETLSFSPSVLKYRNGKTEVRGREVTCGEILPELLEDKPFFDRSGGGVTLSGGEVMLQADGAAELCALLSENGVNTLIDTAGAVPYSEFEKVLPLCSGFLFDYKTASDGKYRDVIGADRGLITDNLKNLLKTGADVHVRIPLIPGFNTDDEDIEDICLSLRDSGAEAVELLPFHRLGASKYAAMGIPYSYKDVLPPDKNEIRRIEEKYMRYFRVKTEK